MGKTVIESFVTQLGFDLDVSGVKEFDRLITSVSKSLLAIVTTAATAATSLFFFTQHVAESIDQLNRLGQSLDFDIEALQEFGYVAELNKGSVGSFNSSLENLTKLASEAARGLGAGVEVFGILGLSATKAGGQIKGAEELIFEISDSIAGLDSQARKLEFISKLGFGRDMLLMLDQGSEAIKRQRKEARELGFVFDKQTAKYAEAFADELLRVQKIIKGVSKVIGKRLMKRITPMMILFKKWFVINKELIQQGLNLFMDKVVDGLVKFWSIAERVVNVVLSLVKFMGGWKATLITVTALLVAMNIQALLVPTLAMALAAGLFLIIEDLVKFAEGGDSALGDLAAKFPEVEKALDNVLWVIAEVRDGWTLLFTEWEAALEGLQMLLKDTGADIKEFLLSPLDKARELFNKFPGIGITQSASQTATAQPGVRGFQQRTQNFVNRVQNNKPTNIFNIAGENAKDIANEVGKVLTQQYSDAQQNLADATEY